MSNEYLQEENALLRDKMKYIEEDVYKKFQQRTNALVHQNHQLTSALSDTKDEIETLRNLLWQYQTGHLKPRLFVK